MAPTVTAASDGTLASGFSSTNPVCSCAAGLVTAITDPLPTCSPRMPSPPQLPPAIPLPPSLPPSYPPYIVPGWINGLGLGPGVPPFPLFAQWLVWLGCTAGTLIAMWCCAKEERARERARPATISSSRPILVDPPPAHGSLAAARPLGSSLAVCHGAEGPAVALEPPAADSQPPYYEPDPSGASDAFLAQLPTRIQYAAARLIEVSGEERQHSGRHHAQERCEVAEIVWLAQPRLLPYVLMPTLVWLACTVLFVPLLLSYEPPEGPLTADTDSTAFGLLLLPAAYTFAFYLLALRRARGVVYALTDSAALELSLASPCPPPPTWLPLPYSVRALIGCHPELRRTPYAQMLPHAPVVSERGRLSALRCGPGRARIFDVQFASPSLTAADRGPLRFCALEAGSQASLAAQLRARVRLALSPAATPPVHVPRLSACALGDVSVSRAEAASSAEADGVGPSLTERSDRSSTRERPPSERRYQLPASVAPAGSAPPDDV
jgi:hypothetical protein